MEERQPIESEIGFADSELVSYERIGEDFTVTLTAWNEKRVTLRFTDTILVVDRGAWSFSDVYQFLGENPLLEEALCIQYEDLPTEHPYRLFQFLNPDDSPSIEVVATSVEVTFV